MVTWSGIKPATFWLVQCLNQLHHVPQKKHSGNYYNSKSCIASIKQGPTLTYQLSIVLIPDRILGWGEPQCLTSVTRVRSSLLISLSLVQYREFLISYKEQKTQKYHTSVRNMHVKFKEVKSKCHTRSFPFISSC